MGEKALNQNREQISNIKKSSSTMITG